MKKNVLLKDHNTMKISCMASYFLEIKSKAHLKEGVEFAKREDLPLFVLGKGSNVIFPRRYEGVVLSIEKDDYKIKEEDDKIMLSAGAGLFLPDASKVVTEKGGVGMEWAGGVPGSIGGAVRGNAGAFGDFMADYVKEVEAFSVEGLEKKSFIKDECEFDYRESCFKKNGNYIVWNVKMEFPKYNEKNKKFEEYLRYREENHPNEPSAGSVFKNPKAGECFFQSFPEAKKFRELGFVPARYLIEKAGLKGKVEGGAQISDKHSNFIINKGGATGADVQKLILLVKETVKEKFQIEMKEEVEIVG